MVKVDTDSVLDKLFGLVVRSSSKGSIWFLRSVSRSTPRCSPGTPTPFTPKTFSNLPRNLLPQSAPHWIFAILFVCSFTCFFNLVPFLFGTKRKEGLVLRAGDPRGTRRYRPLFFTAYREVSPNSPRSRVVKAFLSDCWILQIPLPVGSAPKPHHCLRGPG